MNAALVMLYRDYEGVITKRRVSDATPLSSHEFIAYCHLRDGQRTFRIENVVHAAATDTGEVVGNLWRYFGVHLTPAGVESIDSLTASVRPAVAALIHFTYKIRPFAKRERMRIVDFVLQTTTIPQERTDEIVDWLRTFSRPSEATYGDCIARIPEECRTAAHATAMLIARGSGRKPIDEHIAALASEFASST